MTAAVPPNVDIQLRLLHNALTEAAAEATPEHWQRRADTFENARPRPGDYNGRATAQDLAERDARCAATAQACGNKAAFLLMDTPSETTPLINAVLQEGAA
jgi:hypothetical protein